ncbi:hypothetical protein HZC07_05005 [Candidatus Micrarchaeota archaeon]|nr:hypothetical protein [Candidatus Micrarchaeota archaeon]
MELGIPAFAGTLAGGLVGGEKVGTAFKNAAIVGGITFVTAGLIEGSYSAGWQDKIHFREVKADQKAQYNKYMREGKLAEAKALKTSFESKYARAYNGYGDKFFHTGIEIRGTIDKNGSWGFNPDSKYLAQHPIEQAKLIAGMEVKGEVYAGEIFQRVEGPVSRDIDAITRLYGNIMSDLEATSHPNYSYGGYDCYDWRNEKFIQSGILF